MNKKSICRRHFTNLGYKGRYDVQLLEYITYKFDIFKKEAEELAVYVLEGKDPKIKDEEDRNTKVPSFPSIVEAATVIRGKNANIKIGICVPYDLDLTVKYQHQASNNDIEIYFINGNRVELLNRSPTKKEIEKTAIEEIEKTLNNINKISKAKWEFNLFNIKKNLIEKLSPLANNEKEFIFQITTISSLIEGISFSEFKKYIIPSSNTEKEVINNNQSIGMIEILLKNKNINYDPSIIKNFRDLRDLRNIQPVHSSEKSKKVCRKFIKKLPKSDSDWSELSDIAFKKFRATLILLRNVLR